MVFTHISPKGNNNLRHNREINGVWATSVGLWFRTKTTSISISSANSHHFLQIGLGVLYYAHQQILISPNPDKPGMANYLKPSVNIRKTRSSAPKDPLCDITKGPSKRKKPRRNLSSRLGSKFSRLWDSLFNKHHVMSAHSKRHHSHSGAVTQLNGKRVCNYNVSMQGGT